MILFRFEFEFVCIELWKEDQIVRKVMSKFSVLSMTVSDSIRAVKDFENLIEFTVAFADAKADDFGLGLNNLSDILSKPYTSKSMISKLPSLLLVNGGFPNVSQAPDEPFVKSSCT